MSGEKKSSEKSEKGFKKILPQLLAVGAKNLLLLGYGMTLGFPTIAIPSLKGDPSRPGIEGELVLTKEQISWIGSINLIAVPLGCLLSGVTTQPIGRKKSMQFINIPFIISWLLFHYAKQVELLYLALVITGFSGGILEAPVLTYVAEVTQPFLRGSLSATSTMSITLGVFTQFLLGTFFNWRTVAVINLIFPITAIICLTFIPESPHWLISKHRFNEAKKSLQWLRGWCEESEILEEYNEIYTSVLNKRPDEAAQKPKFRVKSYLKKTFIGPYCLVALAFFLMHFTGITSLQTYAVEIFGTLQVPIDKYYALLILGVLQVTGTLLCVSLIHTTGKRLIAFISTLGTSSCFIIVGAYTFIIQQEDLGDQYSWIPLVFLNLGALFGHMGLKLLPWILIGEVFTNETRSNGAGLASGLGYFFGFTVNKLFFTAVDNLTWAGAFCMYGLLGLIGMVFLYVFLPETEGKSLAEIELHFAGKQKLGRSVRRRNKGGDVEGDIGFSTFGVNGVPVKEILSSEVVNSKM